MDPISITYAIGSIGLFPSRAFLPAFLTAMIIRYGDRIPVLETTQFVQQLQSGSNPTTWFTHILTLWVLGGLSFAEMISTKDPDMRQILDELGRYVKPVMALLAYFGVLGVADAEMIGAIQGENIAVAGMAIVPLAGVSITSSIRTVFFEFLTESDPDDSMGLQRMLSWGEDIWIVLAILMFVIIPVATLILLGLVYLILFIIKKIKKRKEENSKIACVKCEEKILPSALSCFKCGQENEVVCDVGFFGTSVLERKANTEDHPFKLAEKRRCKKCATILPKKEIKQACPACGTVSMGDQAWVGAYDKRITKKMGKVLGICAGFSLFPLIGIIPAMVYYRNELVGPYRRYLPRKKAFGARMLAKVCTFFLVGLQLTPALGIISLPLMAYINHSIYRNAFMKGLGNGKIKSHLVHA